MTHTTGRCETTTPHNSHRLEWVDEQFKNQSMYCHGVCDWCWPFENPHAYYPYVHGPGEHK